MLVLLSWLSFAGKATPPAEQPQTPATRGTSEQAAPEPGAPEPGAPEPGASEPGASELPLVDFTQVRVKRQVSPKFPPEHRPGEAQCVVMLTINTQGRVDQAVAERTESCSEAFAKSVEKAGMKWAFYPVEIDGEVVPAVYPLKVNFKAE